MEAKMEIDDLYLDLEINFRYLGVEQIKFLKLMIESAYAIGGRDEIRKRIAKMEAKWGR